MIVEHDPDVVLRVISASPALYEWFINEWIHLTVLHPEEKKMYLFKAGAFVPYEPSTTHVSVLNEDFLKVIETALKMKTNNIVDATQENLPIQILSH
jgi:hypothetical protein